MTKAQLKVHTENILPIIKKWLYSEKDIFVRELISNACDALGKCRVLRDEGLLSATDEEFKVTVRIDKEKNQLIFSDTGIGMDSEEVEKYIAQIAFSGAEEFIDKYKSNDEKEQIIGHFGLGFYSAYMVSKKVSLETKSYKEGSEGVFWSCDGGTEYEIDAAAKDVRGTDIILDIDDDNKEFLEESKLKEILNQYCGFLPYPIYLNDTLINEKEPLWMKPASSCTDEEYLEFYRALYPMDPDPMFWIHLNVDYPFNLKGILYFPKVHRKFDWSESKIKLFCNRVFVSDNCKDLIPDYLSALKGVLDSPDIPLNVSRSYLQMDRTVRQLATHISKKVADKLSTSFQTDKDAFIKIWSDIEIIVKLGIIQDEKFQDRAKEFLIWKNTKDEWTTLEEYTARNSAALKNKVFYTTDDKEDSPFLKLYKDKGVEVLFSTSPVDSALMGAMERKNTEIKFQRIDGDIDESILQEESEEKKVDFSKLSETISSILGQDKVKIEAKSLASDTLPGFIVVSEEMRRMKEYMNLSNQAMPPELFDKKTFVVNTNCKLISSLSSLNEKDPDLAKDLLTHLYEMSLLSQKELDPSQLSGFVERSSRVLAKLVN
jgi:molecular chaperone HtpG